MTTMVLPHGPWRMQKLRDRVLVQKCIALYNGERMPAPIEAQATKHLDQNSGSANMLNLAHFGRFLRGDSGARDAWVGIMRSGLAELGDGAGYMAPRGRDEFCDKGGHLGYGHVFPYAASIDVGLDRNDKELVRCGLKWLRGFARLNDLLHPGNCRVVGAATRANEAWSDLTNETLALLTGSHTTVGKNFWKIVDKDGESTAQGAPYCLGPWVVRELLRKNKLRVFLDLKDSDLIPPSEKTTMEIWHTSAGFISCVYDLQVSVSGIQYIQPIAAEWRGETPYYCRGERRNYGGPWPKPNDPAMPIKGNIIKHWIGKRGGWVTI